MSDEWEEFLHGPRTRENKLAVSLSRRGELSLNSHAIELLGNPASVVMLFDRTRSRIGLRPSHSDVLNAYRLKQRSDKRRSRPCVLRLKAFCTAHNINPRAHHPLRRAEIRKRHPDPRPPNHPFPTNQRLNVIMKFSTTSSPDHFFGHGSIL